MMSDAASGDAAHPSSAARAGDLETMPLDQVLSRLGVAPDQGLSDAEVRERLTRDGPNALPEHEVGLAKKILHHFTGPIAYMIEAAAVVSAILGRWDDFVIIAGLLLFNAGLELWQNMKASNPLAALKKGLAPQSNGAAQRKDRHRRRDNPGAGRHRRHPPRRHRSRRSSPDRGRARAHRPGRLDRRVAARR